MRLVIATKNKGKIREFKAIFDGTPWEVISAADVGVDIDVVEDGATFEENALKKAMEIMAACGEVTVADDSGLCVDVLGGAPGIYSARYAGEHGSDADNNLKLLSVMEEQTNRAAHFYCAIAAAFPDGTSHTVSGRFDGVIGHEMRGEGGFGYDVLFELPEYDNMTSAEISAELKNKISHRAKALQKLFELLRGISI